MKSYNYLEVQKDRLLLTISYDATLIMMIKDIEGRRWHPDIKRWSFPNNSFTIDRLKKLIPGLLVSTEIKEIKLSCNTKKEYSSLVNDYKFFTKPYKHQRVAFNFLKKNKLAALLMEMGTGKTKVVIDYLAYKAQTEYCFLTLWIAPNSILENEAEEFKKHLGSNSNLFNLYILRGSKDKKIRMLQSSNEASNPVVIVNFESVKTLQNDLLKYKPDVIVVDESTRIKSARAQQSKAIHFLGRFCNNKIIMTGTPVTNTPVDIYSQYKFLDSAIFGNSFMAFRANYCEMGGFQQRQVVAYKNIDDLSKRVYSRAIRYTKDECLDLPKKIYKVYRYDLSEQQRKIYKSLKNDFIAELRDGIVTASQAIVRLIRFQQICSGFIKITVMDTDMDAETTEIKVLKDNPKLKLLESVISDMKITKLIIWCRYIQEIKDLSKLFLSKDYKTYILWGKTPAKDRASLVKDFNFNSTPAVFIGQIRTGGLGINLTGCHTVAYYSNTYSLEDRLQSEDRSHRIGQKHAVVYIDLVARASIEEAVIKALSKKQSLADLITKDIKSATEIIEGVLK